MTYLIWMFDYMMIGVVLSIICLYLEKKAVTQKDHKIVAMMITFWPVLLFIIIGFCFTDWVIWISRKLRGEKVEPPEER